MAPRKKARKSSASLIELEPAEYVTQAREKAATMLQPNESERTSTIFDIEQNIRCIRGILAMNKEIWDRCQGAMSQKFSDGTWVAQRYEFFKIHAEHSDNCITFSSQAQRSSKKFLCKRLFFLAKGLEILPPQYNGGGKVAEYRLIDYQAFFDSSLSLHDDVLEPFLAKLKLHLEKVQVCLGEIDGWLMVAQPNIKFIETTFEKRLEIPRNLPQYHALELKTCETEMTGDLEGVFKISEERDKQKLQKFLEFILL